VWEHCIRVLIGSANLTEPGFRRNQEVMAVLDFRADAGAPKELLLECVRFLQEIRRYAPGLDHRNSGPQTALEAFLRSVEQRVRLLPASDREEAECVVLSLVPGRPSVVDQIGELWKAPAPDQAWVLSPFYDLGQQASDTAARFAELLTTRGARSVVFAAPGRKLPDGKIQIDAPEALKKSSHPSLSHRFSTILERYHVDGKEVDRSLHAKSIWLQRDERALYILGSSNFTAAGLGLHPGHNIELNLAYVISDCASEFGRLCVQSWPRDEELRELEGVQFLANAPNDSAENPDAPVLPGAFGLALYCLDGKGARLELEIGDSAPLVFDVRSKDGLVILDGKAYWREGALRIVKVPWEATRPPSALEVRWRDDKRGGCLAQWIVNVEDMSALPPPDELGSLSLEELMEILTSARPLHELVTRILERREKKAATGAPIEVDPHKKVDTSQFLLHRMRRVAQALEGLRARLQQPMGSIEALRWRLRGPIGPMVLAKRLAEEDPAGAAFMISEVATTLRGVSWQALGSLSDGEVKAEINQTVQLLHDLAHKASAPANLAKYVKDSFAELLR